MMRLCRLIAVHIDIAKQVYSRWDWNIFLLAIASHLFSVATCIFYKGWQIVMQCSSQNVLNPPAQTFPLTLMVLMVAFIYNDTKLHRTSDLIRTIAEPEVHLVSFSVWAGKTSRLRDRLWRCFISKRISVNVFVSIMRQIEERSSSQWKQHISNFSSVLLISRQTPTLCLHPSTCRSVPTVSLERWCGSSNKSMFSTSQ